MRIISLCFFIQQIAQGWRPGAISKRLLRKLNKAKRKPDTVQRVKPTKKTKKRVEDKPTLIICKRNGEYRVEMQVSPENSETNVDQCTPMVYKITREDNDERIQKRLRKRQRLVKEAVDRAYVDPYHPEACEKICLKVYKQAIGLDPNKPECICSDEEEEVEEECSCCNAEEYEDSSDCSSLDLEWEIHFSPPIAYQA